MDFKYLKIQNYFKNTQLNLYVSVVFGWKFVQNLTAKIYPKSFFIRPKWKFIKSIPVGMAEKVEEVDVAGVGQHASFVHRGFGGVVHSGKGEAVISAVILVRAVEVGG
jgi:hypothetical protein